MDDCLETPKDLTEDMREQRALENYSTYNLKNAVFIITEAWKNVKESTLNNSWNKLL